MKRWPIDDHRNEIDEPECAFAIDGRIEVDLCNCNHNCVAYFHRVEGTSRSPTFGTEWLVANFFRRTTNGKQTDNGKRYALTNINLFRLISTGEPHTISIHLMNIKQDQITALGRGRHTNGRISVHSWRNRHRPSSVRKGKIHTKKIKTNYVCA